MKWQFSDGAPRFGAAPAALGADGTVYVPRSGSASVPATLLAFQGPTSWRL